MLRDLVMKDRDFFLEDEKKELERMKEIEMIDEELK